MRSVDRGNFVTRSPYMDAPQGIGYAVTISAPHMVSLELACGRQADCIHSCPYIHKVPSGAVKTHARNINGMAHIFTLANIHHKSSRPIIRHIFSPSLSHIYVHMRPHSHCHFFGRAIAMKEAIVSPGSINVYTDRRHLLYYGLSHWFNAHASCRGLVTADLIGRTHTLPAALL